VELIAETRPFLKLIHLKKLDNGDSYKFPIAFAAFRKAIFNLLLPLYILLLNTFPPLILLFGVSRSLAANCLAVPNFLSFQDLPHLLK